MVGQLEVRAQTPLVIEGRPDAGTEGDDELETVSLDDRGALQISVVGHLGRFGQSHAERFGQVETRPTGEQVGGHFAFGAGGGHEMGGGEHDALPDHARKSQGDAVKRGQVPHKIGDSADEPLGWEGIRGLDSDPSVFHVAAEVEYRCLDAGPSDIDGQGVDRLLGLVIGGGDRHIVHVTGLPSVAPYPDQGSLAPGRGRARRSPRTGAARCPSLRGQLKMVERKRWRHRAAHQGPGPLAGRRLPGPGGDDRLGALAIAEVGAEPGRRDRDPIDRHVEGKTGAPA